MISNTADIISNDEITGREDEKSILLSLSFQIAALRTREELYSVVNAQLKRLLLIDEFGIAQINKDKRNYSAFVLDPEAGIKRQPDYKAITSDIYSIDDCVFSKVMQSDEPVLFHVDTLVKEKDRPAYVDLWKRAGINEMLCVSLKAGGDAIGCIFLHTDARRMAGLNMNLLKGICAQLSVAMSNILFNEEIGRRENEKSGLLAFSTALAAVTEKDQLAKILKQQFKQLFNLDNFVIYTITEDKALLHPVLYDPDLPFAKQLEDDKHLNLVKAADDDFFGDINNVEGQPVSFNAVEWFRKRGPDLIIKALQNNGMTIMTGVIIPLVNNNTAIMTFTHEDDDLIPGSQSLFKNICSQLSVIVSNIIANEKIQNYLKEINKYKQILEQEKLYLKEEIATTQNHAEIVGNSKEMNKVFRMIGQVASSTSTVLLLGETGTGKELVARAIHNGSPRKNKLMIKVNCAALPVNLIESELFGHERGSFTGATDRRLGKFELANHGTLFLDEIGEMPLELQVKLLRAIQEREIERVGGSSTIKVNVRIIAATNRDLEKMMEEGKFRGDLYYRLNIFPIELPPLRNRREDIPALASFFVTRFSNRAGKPLLSFSTKVIQEMIDYNWPGNIRELEHLVERSVLLCKGDVINEMHLLPGKSRSMSVSDQAELKLITIDENEKEHILNILRYCKGKITGPGGAAQILGVPPSTLNSRIKKLGIVKSFLS